MARQRGLIKIIGTLDDVNFYISKGVGYARKAGGGFNGDHIKTKDSMLRVRENASEFGHCSQVKKQFRLALSPFVKGIKGKSFHSRMMQLFLELKSLDSVSERGQRRVLHGLQTAKGKHLLNHYEFTPKNPLLNGLYEQSSFDWTSQQLSVSDFKPTHYKIPKTATHLGVTLGVLDFDFNTLKASLLCSPIHFIEKTSGAVSFDLIPEVIRPTEHTGIAILMVRSYEIIGGEVYDLETSFGVRILDCLF